MMLDNRCNHEQWTIRNIMVDLPDIKEFDMLVFDVDGTLLDFQGFHDELVYLARKVDSEIMTISLASGRTLPNITPIKQSLGISGFIVAENGGIIWDSDQGRDIVSLSDGLRAKEAAKWLSTKIDNLDPRGIESNLWRTTEWCLKETQHWEEIRDILAQSEWKDLDVVSTGFAVHIADPSINKRKGLEIALEQRKIDPRRIIACGDADNDVPMVNLAGLAVAVNDESGEVKNSADIITNKRGKNGAVELLKAILENY